MRTVLSRAVPNGKAIPDDPSTWDFDVNDGGAQWKLRGTALRDEIEAAAIAIFDEALPNSDLQSRLKFFFVKADGSLDRFTQAGDRLGNT